jgi:hypothetical protein
MIAFIRDKKATALDGGGRPDGACAGILCHRMDGVVKSRFYRENHSITEKRLAGKNLVQKIYL